MRFRIASLLLPALLAGCGGYVSFGFGTTFGSSFDDAGFIDWTSNSSGERVVDASNHAFAFYADNGCLYNFQTGRENRAFCLLAGQNVAAFGDMRIRILNVQSTAGTCIAALIDPATGNFIDIQLDQAGREVAAVTAVRAVPCA